MSTLSLAKRLAIRPSFTQLSQGLQTSSSTPYPPPTGYQWAFVIENAAKAIENGQFAVVLEKV